MTQGIDLESLGINQQELQNRLIDRLAEIMVSRAPILEYDDDMQASFVGESPFAKELERRVKSMVDERITALADERLRPRVGQYIEGIILQETTTWGEKRGKTFTFIEYLVNRAEAYMTAEVDADGRSAEECRYRGSQFYGKGHQRLAWMIDKHLHLSIKSAIEKALADVNSNIAIGLLETVKAKLAEALAGLQVQVGRK